MRLPWISVRAHDATVATLTEQLRVERERYDRLLSELLRPEVAEAQQLAPAVRPVRSDIDKVIREQSQGNPNLARHLRVVARDLRREGKNDDEIVGALVSWQSSEDIAS